MNLLMIVLCHSRIIINTYAIIRPINDNVQALYLFTTIFYLPKKKYDACGMHS